MNKYDSIVFTKERFGDRLWEKIGEQLKLLIEAGYICVVFEDDTDIIVIEFQQADNKYGTAYPYWLYPDEEESIVYLEEE